MRKFNLCLEDKVKILKEDTTSIEHTKIGTICGIQLLADGCIGYTVKISLDTGFGEHDVLCSIRDGEYELLEKVGDTPDLDTYEFEH
jgi:hypothetical protein